MAFGPKTAAIAFRNELEEKPDGSTVGLVGQVAYATSRRGRNGKPFLIASLELLGGNVELFVWDNVYQETSDLCVDGTLITVEGKLRNNDGKLSVRAAKAGLFNPQGEELSHYEAGTEAVEEPAPASTAAMEPVAEQEAPLVQTNSYEETASSDKVVLGSNGRNSSNGFSENNNGNAANGDGKRKAVLLNLTDTGNASDDTYLLKSAHGVDAGIQGNRPCLLGYNLKQQSWCALKCPW